MDVSSACQKQAKDQVFEQRLRVIGIPLKDLRLSQLLSTSCLGAPSSIPPPRVARHPVPVSPWPSSFCLHVLARPQASTSVSHQTKNAKPWESDARRAFALAARAIVPTTALIAVRVSAQAAGQVEAPCNAAQSPAIAFVKKSAALEVP